VAGTPYFYSTYDQADDLPQSSKPKVIILGSGPNRIGQGIEFWRVADPFRADLHQVLLKP
jgi:hypothetical protein